jgi:hypothetical protein
VKVHDDVAAVQVLTDPIHQGEGRLAGLVGVVDPTQQVLGGRRRRRHHGRVRQGGPPEIGRGLGLVTAVQGLKSLLMQILRKVCFGDVYFAEAGYDGVQQTMFIFDDDEKARVGTKEFNAPTQRTLGINRQTVGVKKDNGFEAHVARTAFDVGLGEEFEFFANEFDAFAVRAVDKHDVGLDARFLVVVDQVDEIVDEGAFAGAMRAVEQEVGDAIVAVKSIEFAFNCVVHLVPSVPSL